MKNQTFLFILRTDIVRKNYLNMLVVTSREFRDNQAKYMDLVDKNEQVIVQRGKDKAYSLVPISDTDRYFMDPEVRKDLDEGIAQYKAGQVTRVNKDDLDRILGL